MNTITMYLLAIVLVTVNPGPEPGVPKVFHNNPPVYFSKDKCMADAVERGIPAAAVWADQMKGTNTVIVGKVDCLPVKVPFAGKQA